MFCHTVKLRFMDIFNSNSNINKNRTEENLTQMFWTFNLLDWFRRLSEGIKGKTLFCHASNQFFFSIVNKKNKKNFYRRWVFSLINFVLNTCQPQLEGKTPFCGWLNLRIFGNSQFMHKELQSISGIYRRWVFSLVEHLLIICHVAQVDSTSRK